MRGVILKYKKAGGGLGGRAQRLPPRCIGCCCICSCCMSCFVLPFFSLFLCFLFLRAVLGSGVAVRGVILKNKKAGGGLGGRAQRVPPRCIGCCCICSCCMSCCVLHYLATTTTTTTTTTSQQRPKRKPTEAKSQKPLGVVAFVRVACLVLFFRFFPCSYVFCFFVLFLEAVWR